MDERVLALIPMKPTLHPELVRRAHERAGAMLSECREVHELVVDRRAIPGADADFQDRQEPMARLRNALVEAHLRAGHTHVLWIDADVVRYPPDLPRRLLAIDPEAITAPAALMDNWVKRFYDVAGFIENGRRARLHRPWFDQRGPIVALESVGMVYMVPADVYRRGVRYRETSGFTEHYSVCRDSGLPVLCDTRIRAYNADLQQYGEAYH